MSALSLRGRRILEAFLVSSLTLGVASTAAVPARAVDNPAEPLVAAKVAINEGLSGHDQQLLSQARSAKKKTVTVILMADKGKTGSVGADVAVLGGTVTTSADKVGYLRATVPASTVERVAKLPGLAATLQTSGTVENLANGAATTINGSVVASQAPTAGRHLLGEMTVVTDRDAVIGHGLVKITEVVNQ